MRSPATADGPPANAGRAGRGDPRAGDLADPSRDRRRRRGRGGRCTARSGRPTRSRPHTRTTTSDAGSAMSWCLAMRSGSPRTSVGSSASWGWRLAGSTSCTSIRSPRARGSGGVCWSVPGARHDRRAAAVDVPGERPRAPLLRAERVRRGGVDGRRGQRGASAGCAPRVAPGRRRRLTARVAAHPMRKTAVGPCPVITPAAPGAQNEHPWWRPLVRKPRTPSGCLPRPAGTSDPDR